MPLRVVANGEGAEVILTLLRQPDMSDERFAESRAHVRAARFGNWRIEAELRQHGLNLDEEASRQLRASESQRAAELRAARYGGLPADAKERARQARFLAGRGFSADAIRAAISPSRRGDFESTVEEDGSRTQTS